MIRAFYSTPEYESSLKDKYMFAIKKKQEEIDEIYRRTKRIQKFTAYGHISKPDRVFYVEEDGNIYFDEVCPKNICPKEKVEGGEKYVLDSNFDLYIHEFVSKYKRYKVIFSPDGKYGPTVCYCSSIGAVPARMESYDGEVLVIDDESKYDICVA
jgi:hypothetical protein